MGALKFLVAAALTGILLAGESNLAWSITYEEVLDDDPALSVEQRLKRLDKRSLLQSRRISDISRSHDQIPGNLRDGEALALKLQDQVASLQAALSSSTVQTAKGAAGTRGLAWHCRKAREAAQRLTGLADTAVPVLSAFSGQIRAVPTGTENTTLQLHTAFKALHADVTKLVSGEETRQLRTDLREIEIGLEHDWGAYTTLRLLIRDTESAMSAMQGESLKVNRLVNDVVQLSEIWVEEQSRIRQTLDGVEPEYPAEIASQSSIRARLDAADLTPPPATAANKTLNTARTVLASWHSIIELSRQLVMQADSAVDGPDTTCINWQDPPREFISLRSAAQKVVEEEFIRIDQTYAARGSEVGESLATVASIIETDRATIADLDVRLAELATHERTLQPGDDATRVKVRSLQDQGNTLRSEALAEISRMESARQHLTDEQTLIADQRASLATLKAELLLTAAVEDS